MRARNIKPGFWKNEDLVDVPFEYRLLFIGLWMLADREGRLQDRPKRIKMELFPCDSVDVNAGLDELCRLGLLERYESEGVKVILITKFGEHQSPHHSERRSELPGKDGYETGKSPKASTRKPSDSRKSEREPTDGQPTESGEITEDTTDNTGEPTVDLPEVHGEPTVDSRSDNGRNRPDSLNPDSLNPESIETTHGTSADDAPTQSTEPEADTSGKTNSKPYPQEFELAWSAYPRRPGSNPKRQAFKAWQARVIDKHDPADLLAGVIRYADYCEATGKLNTEYVMQGQRFFGPSCEFENDWKIPPRQQEPPNGRQRHSGFSDLDYSKGLKQGVADGQPNF